MTQGLQQQVAGRWLPWGCGSISPSPAVGRAPAPPAAPWHRSPAADAEQVLRLEVWFPGGELFIPSPTSRLLGSPAPGRSRGCRDAITVMEGGEAGATRLPAPSGRCHVHRAAVRAQQES